MSELRLEEQNPQCEGCPQKGPWVKYSIRDEKYLCNDCYGKLHSGDKPAAALPLGR